VFVVGYLGDWRRAAAVLFEPEGLSGNPAPSREKGQRVADTLSVGANQCSGFPGDFTEHIGSVGFECGPTGGRLTDLAPTLDTRCKDGPIRNQLGAGVLCAEVAPTLYAAFGNKLGLDNQHLNGGGGYSLPQVAMCLNAGAMNRQDPTFETMIPVYRCGEGEAQAMAFGAQNSVSQSDGVSLDFCPTLDKSKTPGVMQASAVRRLTPTECERLQGFPDGYTLIPYRGKPASDGPRYKALGNSMAVPVMRWIGERIQIVDKLP
jgi:DNA (cytosine-5)-methyltransferase 1